MPAILVSSLAVHPVKSAAPTFQSEARVSLSGLENDRRFMVIRPDGDFITGRSRPVMTQIFVDLDDERLRLETPGMAALEIALESLGEDYADTGVWGTDVRARLCGEAAGVWLSEVIGEPARLVEFGPSSERIVRNTETHPVAFADAFPLLLISDASLADLNDRLPGPIHMGHFRPNITVEGGAAYQEDTWKTIRIGEVIFDLPEPCSRCVFTTVSPTASIQDSGSEPLQTLARYRRAADGNVYFGQNMIPRSEGTIRLGDAVEVLETQEPKAFQVMTPQPPRRSKNHLRTSPPGAWDGLLRCVRVIEETHDVKTFYFTADPFQRFGFLPGQFVNLQLPIGDEIVHRCYTISSSPTRPDILSITVKRKDDGLVSNWLHDHVAVGTSLKAQGPNGIFHLEATENRKLLLLSAGVGITPMLSMARFIADTMTEYDVVFHHSARTEEDLVAWYELALLEEQSVGMSLSANFSRGEENELLGHPTFAGRLSKEMLEEIAPDLIERDIFCCGPDGYMDAAKAMLLELGLPEAQYHQESFEIAAPAPIEVAEGAEGQTVTFTLSNITTSAEAGQTVLEAAEAAGIDAVFGCRGGACGACKARLLSGEVEGPEPLALDDDEVEEGWILPCSCVAKTALTIEL